MSDEYLHIHPKDNNKITICGIPYKVNFGKHCNYKSLVELLNNAPICPRCTELFNRNPFIYE